MVEESNVVSNLIERGTVTFDPVAWHRAAAEGDIAAINKFLQAEEAQVEIRDENEQSALFIAVKAGHLDVVRVLLGAGAQIEKIYDDDYEIDVNALYIALGAKNIEMTRLLLTVGASVNAKDRDGYTALHWADKDLDLLQLVLASEARVNEKDNTGRTALHWVVEDHHIVNALLAAGANVNQHDDQGCTALHLAAQSSNVLSVEALLTALADVDEKDINGCNALHYAARDNPYHHSGTVHAFFAAGIQAAKHSEYGRCAMYIVYGTGVMDLPRVFRAAGTQSSNINENDDEHYALHCALRIKNIIMGHEVLIDTVGALHRAKDSHWAGNDLELLQLILEAGKKIIAQGNNDCWIELYRPVEDQHIVNDLLAAGASVNEKDDQGSTALHLAAQNGNLSIVQALLVASANVNETDMNGCTPLHYAARDNRSRLVHELIAAGAKVNEETYVHDSALRCAEHLANTLLTAGARINEKDNEGRTALHLATLNGNIHVVQALLVRQADVDEKDMKGCTALHYAARNSCSVAVVNALLSQGAKFNEKDEFGHSPLFYAEKCNHQDIVQALLHAAGNEEDPFYPSLSCIIA